MKSDLAPKRKPDCLLLPSSLRGYDLREKQINKERHILENDDTLYNNACVAAKCQIRQCLADSSGICW